VEPDRWCDETILYEIFVRGFYESGGDGTGDVNGLIDAKTLLGLKDPEQPIANIQGGFSNKIPFESLSPKRISLKINLRIILLRTEPSCPIKISQNMPIYSFLYKHWLDLSQRI